MKDDIKTILAKLIPPGKTLGEVFPITSPEERQRNADLRARATFLGRPAYQDYIPDRGAKIFMIDAPNS